MFFSHMKTECGGFSEHAVSCVFDPAVLIDSVLLWLAVYKHYGVSLVRASKATSGMGTPQTRSAKLCQSPQESERTSEVRETGCKSQRPPFVINHNRCNILKCCKCLYAPSPHTTNSTTNLFTDKGCNWKLGTFICRIHLGEIASKEIPVQLPYKPTWLDHNYRGRWDSSYSYVSRGCWNNLFLFFRFPDVSLSDSLGFSILLNDNSR